MTQLELTISKIKSKIIKKNSIIKSMDLFDGKESNKSKIEILTNEYGETITKIDGNIPIDLEVEHGKRFLFISHDQSRYSHGIHKYPAKFFPELPRWLIQRYSKVGDKILDPFCGSGTSNVEAILNKRKSVGIDVDPFSKLLSKVKTTPLDKKETENNINDILKLLTNFNVNRIHNSEIPTFPYRNNWFQEMILLELTYIRKIINSIDMSSENRNFFMICMSSIIRKVSNADNNCTRTVVRKKLNKNIYPSMALNAFAEAILINFNRMVEFTDNFDKNYRAEFPNDSDARKIKYPINTFHLAITSPPYVNAVDYPRTHQLEMYWLGLSDGSLAPLKRKFVGTENVYAKDYRELQEIGIEIADDAIRKIYEKDPRRAFIALKFLIDMNANLSEIHKVLKKGGKYIVVLGNNKIRGILFESWKYVMRLAESNGFKINNYFGSEIINHFIKVPRTERINTDWIIELEK